jgi:predicted RecA/RadA family phage recombinase
MNNAVDSGSTINYTNGGGATIPAGRLFVAGHILACAIADIPVGETGACQVTGKVTAPKVSAATFAVGEKLVFDVSAGSGVGAFDDSAATPATGDLTGAAVAAEAGLDAETTCTVILTPGNATKTA